MKKRIVSLLACGTIAAGAVCGVAGCDSGTKLTVWASAAQQETLAQMVEEFKAANPDINYDIRIGIGEEDMAYSNVSKDASAAADVYCYSNDQLVPLLRVGALARLGGEKLAAVKANNSAESVKAGSINYGKETEMVYGYPYASDNGYFMFYDKSVLSETDVTSLDTIIEKCEAAGKKIAWALDVPWYTAGWFFTFGCTYNVEYDYNQNYKESVVELNGFDGEAGIKASKAMAQLADSSAFAGKGTDNNTITTGFSTGTTAVAVTGTWLAKSIQQSLGDNYGVCELPSVTVDGETVHLASFTGYKLIGVNAHSSNLPEAHALAAFLSGESMQKVRFEKHLIGPTNTVVANLDAVKNDPTIKALNAQTAHAVEQTSVPSNFWEPLKSYGLNIMDKLVDETGSGEGANKKLTYQQRLTQMVNLMKSSLT
ncbi:MAG: extracellular solute-binding protein [Clostridia bacterium]|nr:extracellular solute-binding protein [Clostridia bacterium]